MPALPASRASSSRLVPRTSPVSSSESPPKNRSSGDAGLARIERGELVERVIEIQHVNLALSALHGVRHKRNASPAPGPLCHLVGTSTIDEDPPHHLRRHCEELRTVLPDGPILVNEVKVDLLHE